MALFTYYSSTDASAPVLHSNADANNMIALLDAVLVNGYGSKTAAGWTHPFVGSGTKQVYHPASGTRFYMRVLDDASLTGARRDCGVRGFESMTDVDTGGPTAPGGFPTVAQMANGVNWRKSTDISTTARPWFAFADGRTLYLFVQTGDTANTTGNWAMYAFGDFFSYVPNDAYNCLLIGAATFSSSAIGFNSGTTYQGDILLGANNNGTPVTSAAHYCARGARGTNSSTNFYKKSAGFAFTSAAGNTSSPSLQGLNALPQPDGAIWVFPLWVMDNTNQETIHGEMRGLYHQTHLIANFTPSQPGDTFGGAGDRVGRTFFAIQQTPSLGAWVVETSNTLRTN